MLQFSRIKRHLLQNKFGYIIVFILFFLGFLIGCIYSNAVTGEEWEASVKIAENFIQTAKNTALDWKLLFSETIRPLLFIFILSFFLFGLPLMLFLIFKCGFSLGFFLAFLCKAFSVKGFFLGSFFLMNYLLFVLPFFLILSYRALRMNWFFLGTFSGRKHWKSEIFSLVTVFVVGSVLLAVGVLVKFWLLPFICGYLFV